MTDTGVVNIHGADYHTVAKRIKDFRENHPGYTIKTKILSAADVVQMQATIRDEVGRTISTGHAEEVRGSTNINKTSSLENCETSCVGRALAFMGYPGAAISSADEIAAALQQQKELELVDRLKAHNAAVRDNFSSVTAIKDCLADGSYSSAYEAWSELTQDDQASLWISTTAGGIFTTQERKQMKSNEWTAARNTHHGDTT